MIPRDRTYSRLARLAASDFADIQVALQETRLIDTTAGEAIKK